MKHAPDVRVRLLAAARPLFARHGYDGTSVRAITARARANLGAITYHFGSKEALYHAVLASLIEPLGDRIELAARSDGAPLEKVETIVRGFFEHIWHNPDMPALMLRELAAGGRPVPPPVAKTFGRALQALTGVIAAGQRDGSIRAGDPMLLALSTVAQPIYLNLARRALTAVAGLNQEDAATFDRIVKHAVETVRAALADHRRGTP